MEDNKKHLKNVMSKVKKRMQKSKDDLILTATVGLLLGGATGMKVSEQHELKQEMKKMEQIDAQATPHAYTSFNLKKNKNTAIFSHRHTQEDLDKSKNFIEILEENGFQITNAVWDSSILNISDANGKSVGMIEGRAVPDMELKQVTKTHHGREYVLYYNDIAMELTRIEVLDEATELMKLMEQNYEKSYSSKIWMVEGETLFSAHQRSEKLASHKNDHLNYASHEFHL